MKRNRLLLIVFFLAVIALSSVATAEGALTWSRIGKGGLAGSFNNVQPSVVSSCEFKGHLYFGTGGFWERGGQVWRYDGKSLVLVHKPKPGTYYLNSAHFLAVLGDYLYAGLNSNHSTCELWRTKGGGAAPYAWTKVSGAANLEKGGIYRLTSMTAAKGALYLGAYGSGGGLVWKYDGSAWSQIVGQGSGGTPTGPGFGSQKNSSVSSLAASASGDLYAGTENYYGAEVWRMSGSTWAKVNKPGFGTAKNSRVSFLTFFNKSLCAGTYNYEKGCQVWRFVGPGPSNWKAVGLNGLGDPKNRDASAAAVFGNPGQLHILTYNYNKGAQVLRTNGKKWEKANTPGFGLGEQNYDGASLAVFGGKLYAGLGSDFGGRVYATGGGSKLPFAWSQVGDTGFSRNGNEGVTAAAFYGGKLYVGTESQLGCEIWRYESRGWTRVATAGFGNPYNSEVLSMAVTNLGLHVGTQNGITGAEVWRFNGKAWSLANTGGFGDEDTTEASAMFVQGGKLYVGTSSYEKKGQVWRCDGPGPGQWTQVNTNGFGVSHTVEVSSLTSFNNKLYAGTYDSNDPCRVWRFDGPGPSQWTPVSEEGFGDTGNHYVQQLAVYKGSLYAGVWNAKMTGCEIWRYSGSGTSWTKVNQSGFGTKDNNTPESMIVFGNLLYVATANGASGGQVWAYDGSSWTKDGKNGLGTAFNWAIHALVSDGHNLYAGTGNGWNGGEVWTTGAGSDSPLIRRESPFSAGAGPGRAAPKKILEIDKKTR